MAKGTKERILEKGIEMWLENPSSVNAHAIAKKLGMTHGAVLYHFPKSVKDNVAEHAVKVDNKKIIAQLITSSHPAISNLTELERAKYLFNF